MLEELCQLNIPWIWKQVKYNIHNAYQAVSRRPMLHEFGTCVKLGTHHATFVGPTIVVCREDDDDC